MKKHSKAKNAQEPEVAGAGHSAYKALSQTDGIVSWTKHTFDNRVPWTIADEDKWWAATSRLGPLERIEDMEAMLTALPTGNPAITLHVNAIRAIHLEVQRPPFGFTLERLARLEQASELWAKILVIRDLMPIARDATLKKEKQKVSNKINASAARPSRRTVDHEEVEAEFLRLCNAGHTRREANGLLVQRGIGVSSTITKITRKVVLSDR